MLEILRDSLWQSILGVLAIAVTVWVYHAQRPKKRLMVERVARVPLVTLGSSGIDGLRITFEDRALQSAIVVLAKVECVGNVPILANDYESPLCLSFEEGAVVCSADRVESLPVDIPVILTCNGSQAVVAGVLLNPGDSFTVRMLIENSKGRMTSAARVVGVAKIEPSKRVSYLHPSLMAVGFAIFLMALWVAPANPARTVPLRAEDNL